MDEETKKAIAEAAAKAAADAVASVKAELAKKATSNAAGMPGTSTGPAPEASVPRFTDAKDPAKGTGLNLARFVKAQFVGKMNHVSPVQVLKAWGYEHVANQTEKAMAQGTLAAGGALVPDEYRAELVELLGAKTVVRAAGAVQMPMASASMTIPKETGNTTAYWGAENTAITPSEMTVGSLQLQEKKLTALVPISNDLIRNASISAEQMVTNNLVKQVARAEDLKFLRGVGDQNSPRGIRYWAASGNVITETAATDPATLAEVKADAARLINKLEQADVPMGNVAWVFHPRVKNFLRGLTETTGASAFDSLIDSGKWYGGFPFYTTTQLPITLQVTGTTNETEIYLVDFSCVVIGDSMGMEVEVFPNGAWSNSGTIVSGISSDQSVIRVIKKTDLIMTQDLAAAIIKDSEWGA